MKIKVLGTGCSKCKSLYANVELAVKELGGEAEVVKVEDMGQILNYNIMSLPAIVVDEKVLAIGTISVKQIKEYLKKLSDMETSDSCDSDYCLCK